MKGKNRRKKLRLSIWLVIFFIGSSNSLAFSLLDSNDEKNKFHLSTTGIATNSDINSKASETSLASSGKMSVFGQNLSAQYFLNESWALVGNYFFALVVDIDAEIQGFDLGVEYFPLKNGASKELSILGSTLLTSPEWAPYVALNASTRDVQFSTVNFKFQGIQLQAGTYWHFKSDLFLKGHLLYEMHNNNNVRTLTTTGLGFGVGKKF